MICDQRLSLENYLREMLFGRREGALCVFNGFEQTTAEPGKKWMMQPRCRRIESCKSPPASQGFQFLICVFKLRKGIVEATTSMKA